MKIKRTILRSVLVCIVFALILSISPNAKGLADSVNSAPTPPLSPPSLGGSTYPVSPRPPSKTDNSTDGICPFNSSSFTPIGTPIVRRNADGSEYLDFGTLDSQTHWFSIDWWTSLGYGLPSKMNGTFKAVNNTIDVLETGDTVMYLPLNVAYGTSASNSVWFQFDVAFSPGDLVQWFIWDIRGPADSDDDYAYTPIPSSDVPYIAGHTYDFELTPSGSNTLTFWIRDTNNASAYWSKNTWHWSIPNLNMLNLETMFSPASAVEGKTTNSQLTNVPYFMTHVGYQTPAHWHSTQFTSVPDGISTKVWYDGNYYYWAMIVDSDNHYYMTTADGSAYGMGWVYNPTGLVGSAPDSNWAFIWGPSYGSGGNIHGNMNTVAGGNVYVYGCTYWDYPSDLLVYASYDYQNWYQIGTTITVTWDTPEWISIGTSLSGFKYIAVVGYNTGNPVGLWLDAVWVGSEEKAKNSTFPPLSGFPKIL